MSATNDPLRTAWEHHAAGRFQQAAAIYREILTANPRNAEAAHRFGLLLHQMGDHEQAAKFLTHAIRVDSKAEYHHNLGEVYRASGRMSDAEASYRRALTLDPRAVATYYTLALLHRAQGNAAAVAADCQQALALNPNFREARHLLASAHWSQGDRAAARSQYESLAASNPNDSEALLQLGTLARDAGQFAAAESFYRRAEAIEPTNPRVLVYLGDLAAAQAAWPAAIEAYRNATQLGPDSATSAVHLAIALQATGELPEAVEWYRRAIALEPNHANAHFNLGTALDELGHAGEAAAEYEAVLRIDPAAIDAHLNLGAYYQSLGDSTKALAHYDSVLAMHPGSPQAHFNRALLWLAEGNWTAAWPEYEWRVHLPGFPVRNISLPRWDGRPAPEQTLLLHTEQGYGDTLHALRCLPLARSRGKRVVLLAPPELVPLLAQSGIEDVFGDEAALPPCDVQLPLMSMFGVAETTPTNIPGAVPYLDVDPALVARWRQRLGAVQGLKVGICWQVRPGTQNEAQRTFPLAALEPLARMPGVALVSLQRMAGLEQLDALAGKFSVVDLRPEFEIEDGAFLNAAAVIKSLDLVISADTAIGHLAGALNAPVWLALHTPCDWRWLRQREDTPWYPSMRLFRQPSPGDWPGLFAKMASALASLAAAPPAP